MPSYDISEETVFSIGYPSQPSASSSLWSNSGFNYDWAIAGKPFLSIASDEFQLIRSFVQVNKQQFDNRNDPGEQTLSGWWLRSQYDFGCGAGQTFFEPTHPSESSQDPRVTRKFKSSYNVNVWTPGQATLLPSMSQLFASTGDTEVVTASNGTTSYVYGLTGTGVSRSDGTTTTTITGWASTPTGLASTGNAVLGFYSTGIDISVTTGTTATTLWTHSLGAGNGWFVKERIIAAFGSDLYSLGLGGGSIGTSERVFQATGTSNSITWVSATAAPDSILVAGNRGLQGFIYKFSLASNGTTTALTAGYTVAELPPGETIRDINVYLGTYLTLVTSAGVRIGTVNSDGGVTYGPLSYTGTAQGHSVGRDRFIYVGVTDAGNATSGCIRLDLSEIDSTGRAAWANDVDTGVSGEVDAVCSFGTTDRIVIGVHGQGIYIASATQLAATGYLTTSRVRYSTLEPKTFQIISVRANVDNGSIGVSSLDVNDSATSLYTLNSTSQSAEIGFASTSPVEYASAKFDFARSSTDATKGPTLRGWQMKALPAVTRKQQWRIPFLCFDSEQDRFGNRSGYTGSAIERYEALRAALLTGVPVSLQDLIAAETFTVLVEDVQFYQTSPPQNANGFGGVLIVQCREL